MRKSTVLFIFSMLLYSCSNEESSVKPVVLINEIRSYQSIESAKNLVLISEGLWEVIENSKSSPKDKRPPFYVFTVKIHRYRHLQQPGELVLHFFNNQLMSTWFYPDKFSEYLQILREQKDINLIDQAEVLIFSNVRIWKNKDYKGQMYIAWEDTRLAAKKRKWIRRYS